MPSYIVTGASRGLGYEFLRQFSLSSPDNVVIDLTNLASLEAARAEIRKITPSIDYLINNAAEIPGSTAFTSLSDHISEPAVLEKDLRSTFETNVIGVIRTVNTFLPLVQKSSIKKVITITSGLADNDLTNEYEIYEAGPYSISKAAVNAVVAKYNARHKKEGILFLAISPGLVDTGNTGMPPPDSELPQKFGKAYPHFTGPITPEESVKAVMDVVGRARADNEFAGEFVSHFGNKQWL